MIVTLSSVRGAPGVSTWAMLLAAAWPDDRQRVVLEADLDGGVAGARYGIGVDPGVDELVARFRHRVDTADALAMAGRRIDEHGWIVPGPESAIVARRIWDAPGVVESVASAASADTRVWLCDCGRLGPGSALAQLAASATLNLVVTGDAPADLVQVPDRVDHFARVGRDVAVLVCGSPSYPIGELAAFFATDHVLVGPRPDLAAIDLVARGWNDRRLRRSEWWRAALSIAVELSDIVDDRQPGEVVMWDAPITDASQHRDGSR